MILVIVMKMQVGMNVNHFRLSKMVERFTIHVHCVNNSKVHTDIFFCFTVDQQETMRSGEE